MYRNRLTMETMKIPSAANSNVALHGQTSWNRKRVDLRFKRQRNRKTLRISLANALPNASVDERLTLLEGRGRHTWKSSTLGAWKKVRRGGGKKRATKRPAHDGVGSKW